jgi:hypothetical protein
MQPQLQKKVARAYGIEGTVVLYRSAARSLFKAERSLLRAEPWWSIVLGAPLFLRTLLRLVFLCPHRHKGPPIRLRESIPSSLSGYRTVHGRVTYITCLDCGQKLAYNHKTGRLVDFWGIHNAEAVAGLRRRVDGFFSPIRGLAARVGRLNGIAMSELVRSVHYLGTLTNGQWTKIRGLYSTRRDRGSRPEANRVTYRTALTKKVSRSENGDDGLFPDFIDYGELHTAFLQVHRRSRRHHLER